ncbi:hypothetical protein [Parashewanella tropica]|uniref:hypothetical protein n=1 Tax=Parashewanella tropica TaxID=2547970 RepID=UPI001059F7E3|nr:hypothetical protein [Parashewanella tropica]
MFGSPFPAPQVLQPFYLALGIPADEKPDVQKLIINSKAFSVAMECVLPLSIMTYFGGAPALVSTTMTISGRFGSQVIFEPAINFIVDKTDFRQENKQVLKELSHLSGTLAFNYLVNPSHSFLNEVFFNFFTFQAMKMSAQLTVRLIDNLGFENYKTSKYICCKLVESGVQTACFLLFFPRKNAVKLQESHKGSEPLSKSQRTILPDGKLESATQLSESCPAFPQGCVPKYSACSDVEGFTLRKAADPLFYPDDSSDSALLAIGSGAELFEPSRLEKRSKGSLFYQKVKQGKILVEEMCTIKNDQIARKLPRPVQGEDFVGSLQYVFKKGNVVLGVDIPETRCTARMIPCLVGQNQITYKTKGVDKTEFGLHKFSEKNFMELLRSLGYRRDYISDEVNG